MGKYMMSSLNSLTLCLQGVSFSGPVEPVGLPQEPPVTQLSAPAAAVKGAARSDQDHGEEEGGHPSAFGTTVVFVLELRKPHPTPLSHHYMDPPHPVTQRRTRQTGLHHSTGPSGRCVLTLTQMILTSVSSSASSRQELLSL